MQQRPEDAMEEVEAEAEAAPKAAAGPELGFWLAARRRLAPDDPFFAAGDLERELLAKHVRLIASPLPRPRVRSQLSPFCERFGTAREEIPVPGAIWG
jgi:hypothetical protein